MRIAFYFEATWGWTAGDLIGHGVGGTETAMGNMARAFARLGHQVTVFHPTPRPCSMWGVRFRHVADLGLDEVWDVFIALSRVPELRRIRAEVKVYWCLEHIQQWVGDWRAVLPEVDSVFTISPYHTALLMHRYGLPADRLFTTSCAVDAEEYAQLSPKVAGRLLWCSVPDRGLHHLPPIYRLIRGALPFVSLAVTSDFTLWGLPGGTPGRDLFAGLPGVRLLGRVDRPRLVRLQKESVLHVYPSTFQELFCLASLECQAAGTPTVASDLGALPSTVEDGTGGLIVPVGATGRVDFERSFVDEFTPQTCELFAARVVELLEDAPRLRTLAGRARSRALTRFSSEAVARQWLAAFPALRGKRQVG